MNFHNGNKKNNVKWWWRMTCILSYFCTHNKYESIGVDRLRCWLYSESEIYVLRCALRKCEYIVPMSLQGLLRRIKFLLFFVLHYICYWDRGNIFLNQSNTYTTLNRKCFNDGLARKAACTNYDGTSCVIWLWLLLHNYSDIWRSITSIRYLGM